MFLSEIAHFLEVAGHGTRGADLFAGEIPAGAPALAVGLLEPPGAPPQFVHNQNAPIVESPGLQVRVRGPDYEAVRSKAQAIADALTFRNRVLDGVLYLSVLPTQTPFDLGRDGNERHIVICNFEVTKQR